MTKNNLLVIALFTLLMFSCSTDEPKNSNNEEPNKLDSTPKSIAAPSLDALQKDPDVLWIGEVMVDYAPNLSSWASSEKYKEKMKSAGFKGKTMFKILKYQAASLDDSKNEDHLLATKIIKNKDKIKHYKDDDLSEMYAASELKEVTKQIDTIMTFDPKTFKEVERIFEGSFEAKDINFFRMKQLIYYSKKDITFKVIPLAIAPMIDNGKNTGSKPIFWVNVNFMVNAPEFSSGNITWAKRIHRGFDLKDVKVLKEGDGIAATIETFVEDIRTNADKIYVAHTFDSDGNQKMTKEELKNLGSSIDTIITFDPKSFKEKMQVVKNNFKGDDIQRIRLMQDWFWNEKTKELTVRYAGFKPIVDRVDEMGNFLNSGPMLTRRPDRDGE
jgi:hypothetical protein